MATRGNDRRGSWWRGASACALLAAPLCASQSTSPAPAPAQTSGPWILEHDEDGSTSLFLRATQPAPTRARGEAELVELANARLREASGVLGIDLADFAIERVTFLPLGWIGSTDKLAVRYRQSHAGIPVEGGASVLLDTRGRLLAITSTSAAAAELATPPPAISAGAARGAALAEFEARTGVHGVLVGAASLLYSRDAEHPERAHTLVWTQVVRSAPDAPGPLRMHEARISAARGAVEQFLDRTLRYDVTGLVAGWITPGILPDDSSHPAIAQTTCTPCTIPTCGACPPISCAVPASSGGPSAEIPVVMPDLEVMDEHGNVTHTDLSGSFRLPGSAPLTVTVRFRGRRATVSNEAGPSYVLSTTLVHDDENRIVMGGPAPYAGDQILTAQANAYWWTTRLRNWIAEINPADATWEQEPLPKLARVNMSTIVNYCTARWLQPTGSSGPETWYTIGGDPCGLFPPSAAGCGCCGEVSGTCTNKANATVILHEMGHWMNYQYFGVSGATAFNEGLADVWATYVTGQPQLFPYYCTAGTCARSGENCRQFGGYADQFFGLIHDKGEPLMGATWQVRERIIAARGDAAGGAIANAIFLAWVNTYPEFALHTGIKRRWAILDDDDANPMTPSPHVAEIFGGFASHGL